MTKSKFQTTHHDLPKKVAKGAAGVAVAAGVIAAGAALMDQETRDKLGDSAQKGISTLKDSANDFMEGQSQNYQRVTHEVARKRSKGKKGGKK